MFQAVRNSACLEVRSLISRTSITAWLCRLNSIDRCRQNLSSPFLGAWVCLVASLLPLREVIVREYVALLVPRDAFPFPSWSSRDRRQTPFFEVLPGWNLGMHCFLDSTCQWPVVFRLTVAVEVVRMLACYSCVSWKTA